MSIEFVLVELFERIGHLLYSQAFVDDPARQGFVFDLPKLDASLARWENDPACQAARRDVNNMSGSGVERFLDPVDYLRYIQNYVPWKVAGPADTTTIRPASADPEIPDLPGLPRPLPVHVIPRHASRLCPRRPAWPQYLGRDRPRPGDVAHRLRLRRHGPVQPGRLGLRQARDRAEDPGLSERVRRRRNGRLRS